MKYARPIAQNADRIQRNPGRRGMVWRVMLLLVGLVFGHEQSLGQSASATWSLASNTNAVTSGNITGASFARGSGLADGGNNNGYYYSRAYNNGNLTNAVSGNDYLQFSFAPSYGYDLNITSISFNRAVSSNSGTLFISVLFSTDATFASYTNIGNANFNNTTLASSSFPGLDFDVFNGQTLYVRIYGWNLGTSYYFRTNNVVISGTTSALNICTGTPAPGNTIASANSVCAGSQVNLSLQNSTSGAGVTYQWQSSPDNSIWTNTTPEFIETDFSSLPANTNVYGDATVTGGVLRLTRAVSSVSGGFVLQNTPGSDINPFTVQFDYRIWDGTGADGMSLSYASNINNDSGGGESGEGSGIILKFDTYDNAGGATNSQIMINYNGSQIWSNSVGAFNLRNSSFRTVRMTVDNGGYLTLSIAGTMIVNGLLLPGYTTTNKSNWKFKFSGRTGGATDNHSIDNLKIQYGDNASFNANPSSSTYYRCLVTCATNGSSGNSTGTLVSMNTLSTPPSSINGTSSICAGSSTTLTTSGGTLGTDARDVWYSGGCPVEAYTNEWQTQPFATPNTTVNSVSGGILNVTSTNNDPMIDMGGLGSFDPNTYRYVQIRYQVTGGNGNYAEIFFYNTVHNYAVGLEEVGGSLISDGNWHFLNLDMWTDPDYLTGGNIVGWRFDWAGEAGVTMNIDFITLATQPILDIGTSITVTPTENTTYYTLKKGECNTTSCASQLVTVHPIPVFTATIFEEINCYGGNNGKINVTVSSVNNGTYTYSLNNGAGYIGTLPGTYPAYRISGLTAGNYRIKIKDTNNCVSADCP